MEGGGGTGLDGRPRRNRIQGGDRTVSQEREAPDYSLTLDDEAVASYLRTHPDFFLRHGELLTEITIPHRNGGAISLVEHQVAALRDQNTRLRRQFHELVEVAKENERLSRRLHELTLRIMAATSAGEIFRRIRTTLVEDFGADAVEVRIFAEPAFLEEEGGEEFTGAGDPVAQICARVIERGEPLCGRLRREQHEALFGERHEEIASAAVIPLTNSGWSGLLAIGSSDPGRYHPEMGVDLLAHLGDVASLVIDPWVAAPDRRD
ncbi:MAG: DUF484 family protein [Gammaproteobacteria bacterium]|nr:MAG: DUF484 family protein [Gammaproteobacteria bacterium]